MGIILQKTKTDSRLVNMLFNDVSFFFFNDSLEIIECEGVQIKIAGLRGRRAHFIP